MGYELCALFPFPQRIRWAFVQRQFNWIKGIYVVTHAKRRHSMNAAFVYSLLHKYCPHSENISTILFAFTKQSISSNIQEVQHHAHFPANILLHDKRHVKYGDTTFIWAIDIWHVLVWATSNKCPLEQSSRFNQ